MDARISPNSTLYATYGTQRISCSTRRLRTNTFSRFPLSTVVSETTSKSNGSVISSSPRCCKRG